MKELGFSDAIVSNIPQQIDAYILYVMAKIRYFHRKPGTFEYLALKLMNCFRKGENEVYFATGYYFHNSLKATECKTRREKRTFIIKSIKSKVPSDFQSFFKK